MSVDVDLQSIRRIINESDRGCVLLTQCFIDDSLAKLHEAHFTAEVSDSKDMIETVLKGRFALLHSFAARIKIAYAYGFIGRGTYDDLERLRDLRNDAAHLDIDFQFDTQSIRDRVHNFDSLKRMGQQKGLSTEQLEQFNAAWSLPPARWTTKMYFMSSSFALGLEIFAQIRGVMEKHHPKPESSL